MGAPEDLRAWRGERTLREAADVIGCDPSYLSLLENRKRVPGDRKLSLRLHRIVGIPPEAWDLDEADGDEPADAHGPTMVDTLTAVKGPSGDSSGQKGLTSAENDADPPHKGAA